MRFLPIFLLSASVFAQTINFSAQCPVASKPADLARRCSVRWKCAVRARFHLHRYRDVSRRRDAGRCDESARRRDCSLRHSRQRGKPRITTIGTGFTNPMTITFPQSIQNFFVTVLNGNTIPVSYMVADNAGNSATYLIPPIYRAEGKRLASPRRARRSRSPR